MIVQGEHPKVDLYFCPVHGPLTDREIVLLAKHGTSQSNVYGSLVCRRCAELLPDLSEEITIFNWQAYCILHKPDSTVTAAAVKDEDINALLSEWGKGQRRRIKE